MKTAIYCRVSTDNQEREAMSLLLEQTEARGEVKNYPRRGECSTKYLIC